MEQNENLTFLLEYLGQFCERLPTDVESEDLGVVLMGNSQVHTSSNLLPFMFPFSCQFVWQEALTWVSITFGLNPQFGSEAEHRAAHLY